MACIYFLTTTPLLTPHSLFGFCHDTFVFSRSNILQRPLEVALGAFEVRIRSILVGLQVAVDELNEAIEVLGRYGFVLLVEIVDVAV